MLINEAYSVLINPLKRKKYDKLYKKYYSSESKIIDDKKELKLETKIDKIKLKSTKKAKKRLSKPVKKVENRFEVFDFLFTLLDVISFILELFGN